MNKDILKKHLLQFKDGEISLDNLFNILKDLPFKNINYAKVDHHRAIRKGLPEVIYGENKSVNEIIGIINELKKNSINVLVTRLSFSKSKKIISILKSGKYCKKAKTLRYDFNLIKKQKKGKILLITAGTSDSYVASECNQTLLSFGFKPKKLFDVGVAGIHRLLNYVELLQKADVIIVFAGMEGALPSVVGGLVQSPVIAVPTNVGYGSSLNGITALLGMLNSCASNVAVVNIDNGFGAAYIAASICNRIYKNI